LTCACFIYDSVVFLFRMCLQLMTIWKMIGLLALLPVVSATMEQSFPDLPFSVFSKFIETNFDPSITLSTVLMLLLTMTENVDILSLHGRQRKAIFHQEKSTVATGWIRTLGREVLIKVGEKPFMERSNDTVDEKVRSLGLKLDLFAKLLGLSPCNEKGKYVGRIKPVSKREIQPVHIICPESVVCETTTCKPRALLQHTKQRDIPLVTLIKDFQIYEQIPVLCGHCPVCNTLYYADHERKKTHIEDKHDRVYLNSAKYVKIGRSLWVDRLFKTTVLSGFYHFHTSAATFAAFWNSISSFVQPDLNKLSRRQIWQAYVQESIRFIASKEDVDLIIEDGLPIDEITKEAYKYLGNQGIIQVALDHSCAECTQEYKSRADFIGNVDDDAATVGMGDVDANIIQGPVDTVQSDLVAPVKMVVIDGIVMGHTVSIIVSKWIDLHIFISIVHMRTAFLTWLMHVVVFIVDIMRISMEENVMLPIAQVIRKQEHRPV
jgi:hypothetical protein